MKKKVIIVAVMCALALNSNAQYYGGEEAVRFPVADLYDQGTMNMYLRALAETAAIRKENYFRYSDMAIDAFKNGQWNYVIHYVNEALNTKYYCGDLYYMRGYAYEQLGKLRAAKKDYKKGMKNNSQEAALALASLKDRKKRR